MIWVTRINGITQITRMTDQNDMMRDGMTGVSKMNGITWVTGVTGMSWMTGMIWLTGMTYVIRMNRMTINEIT